MNDNEKVEALLEGLLGQINAAALPLAVKALALENLLLRVNAARRASAGTPQHPAEEGEAP